ncbi:MAG: hypothetical protein P8X73_01545 [Ignavibacteriaceae bacterium]|jgi:hypothetical protein
MTELNAHQELAFIKKVMEDSRRIICDDGKSFIFWGILISFGMLITYLKVAGDWGINFGWFWPVLIALGWIGTMAVELKAKKKRATSTFAARILGSVWISCGVAMTILGFAGSLTNAYNGVFISPIISVVLGIGYLITGVIHGKKWVSLLSIGWWLGALLMFYLQNLETLLIMTGMMIFLQTIPGILLYKESKRELTTV